jgi:hypothetical protein
MKYHLLKMIGLFFLFSCTGRISHDRKDTLNKKETDTNGTAKIETAASDSVNQETGSAVEIKTENIASTSDTTWFPFSDSSYQLNVHIFNTDASSEDEINSVITYNHVRQGKTKQIFRDSFYCMDKGYMLRQDLNDDHIQDVLIFCYSGVRANPSYHLFLADTIRHKLTYVKGFEELPNPSLDPVYNVIASLALSGTSDYRFYRINSKNKLISLGHGYEERDNDSTQYERAIRAIIMDRQRKAGSGQRKLNTPA